MPIVTANRLLTGSHFLVLGCKLKSTIGPAWRVDALQNGVGLFCVNSHVLFERRLWVDLCMSICFPLVTRPSGAWLFLVEAHLLGTRSVSLQLCDLPSIYVCAFCLRHSGTGDCLPCIEPGCPSAELDGDAEFCNVCWTESLVAAPCVKVSLICGFCYTIRHILCDVTCSLSLAIVLL